MENGEAASQQSSGEKGARLSLDVKVKKSNRIILFFAGRPIARGKNDWRRRMGSGHAKCGEKNEGENRGEGLGILRKAVGGDMVLEVIRSLGLAVEGGRTLYKDRLGI